MFLISLALLWRGASAIYAMTPYDPIRRNPANFRPLTPLSFRAGIRDLPNQTAIIHGGLRRSTPSFTAARASSLLR
jgi:hypothetical protein